MKKLILIDDPRMLRKGITAYLAENSDWKVIFEAERLSELSLFLSSFNDSKEDTTVAVVDLQLKEEEGKKSFSDGFEAVKLLEEKGIPSVIFSSHDSGACIERAMGAEVRAKGFVSKCSSEQILLDAINTVSTGKTYIQPDLITSFLETHNLFSMLTKREQQVVKLIEQGKFNDEIAAELNIKVSTLENYISIIYDKLGCSDRAALMAKLG